jgi:uncharacterized protein YbcV (DUF1398 family)
MVLGLRSAAKGQNMKPISKTITVGNQNVQTTAAKILLKDGSVVISVTANIGGVSHTQNMTISSENANYSAEQCQKDFDTHCLKVATAAAARANADAVTESLK